jgi:hypothetical protein
VSFLGVAQRGLPPSGRIHSLGGADVDEQNRLRCQSEVD